MVKIAVCDDSYEECVALERALKKALNQDITIAKHDNYFSFTTYVLDEVKGQLDVVFIGLNVKGYSGVKIAQTLLSRYSHLKIIFVTKYLELVKDIFMINPVYLLIKPYEMKYVTDAIYKAIRTVDEEKNDFLVLKAKYGRNGIISVRLKDFYYAASDRRKLEIVTDEETIEINMKLNDLEERLPDNFLRVHQSYLVNMDKILKITKEEVYLYNDVVIPISRSRLNHVNETYMRYLNVFDEQVKS